MFRYYRLGNDYSNSFFFFNDPATTEIYTLSLHDALPIFAPRGSREEGAVPTAEDTRKAYDETFLRRGGAAAAEIGRHTSELQSRQYLVCRLLLEKKKNNHLLYYYSILSLELNSYIYIYYR